MPRNKRLFSKSFITVIVILAIIILLIIFLRTNKGIIKNVREGAESGNLVCKSPSLTVALTNNSGPTDPNPIGTYTITFNNQTVDLSLNQSVCIPYTFNSSSASLQIIPKDTSATIARKPHYADVFPETYLLDMTFKDSSNNILWAVKESSNSRIDVSNKTLDIKKLGIIYDSKGTDVGVVKNDMYDTNRWKVRIDKYLDINTIKINWIISADDNTVPKRIKE
jgi:hypothetical protein